jgi:nucleotide-binding universal stress UspA family protein
MTMFKAIVVATDGSEHGSQALTVGRAMAAESGAHLTVVHVTELVGGKGGVYPAAADEEQIRERIAQQVAQLQRRPHGGRGHPDGAQRRPRPRDR